MADKNKVDVAVNVYGKPYQTVLSILSLLKYSKNHMLSIFYTQTAHSDSNPCKGINYVIHI